MNPAWRGFLTANGGTVLEGDAVEFASRNDSLAAPTNFISALTHFALLEVTGSEARKFLHSQLTSDIEKLENGRCQFSAWCNPKGRVIANFLVMCTESGFYLLLPGELGPLLQKRLQIYVLRADVSISTHMEDLLCMGVYGETAITQLEQITRITTPEPYRIAVQRDRCIVTLPLLHGVKRIIVMQPPAELASLWRELSAVATPADNQPWKLLDIQANLPWITVLTSEQFLPQELNLENSGGLSYGKGCYPGQEVIARVHYRGQVKKTLVQASINTGPLPAAGTPLYGNHDEHTIGTLINAATGNGIKILAVMEKDRSHETSCHLGSADGPVLHVETAVAEST